MRADHFTRTAPHPGSLGERNPALAAARKLLKNVLGIVVVATGIAMLVLPGQGLLTILIGLTLLDFPGRRKLQLALLRERHVRRTVDRIRARAGRPPLELDSTP